jgi:glycosyltransferase involved in cell wall biosynthesis
VTDHRDEHDQALAGERANAAHWRQVAEQRNDALRDLRRKTSVRAALAAERKFAPLLQRASALGARVRAETGRIALATQALPTRPLVAFRARRLEGGLTMLPDLDGTGDHRTVSVVVFGPPTSTRVRLHAREVVAVVEPSAPAPVAADRVVRRTIGEPVAAAAARAAATTTGDLLCFVESTAEPMQDDWLVRLAHPLDAHTRAAGPLVVHPRRAFSHATRDDVMTRALGLEVVEVSPGVPALHARDVGARPDLQQPPSEVAALPATCIVVDRATYDEVGGLAPLAGVDAAIAELCLRMGERGARIVAVPSVVVADTTTVPSPATLRAASALDARDARDVVERHGAAMLRALGGAHCTEALRIAITVGVPSRKIAHRWGDWHLATALARALERVGQRPYVDTVDHADDLVMRACDVHLVVRGLAPVRRTLGQRHVLWVISHPETITTEECDEADLVLVASERFAAELRRLTTTPVEVFQQATDHHRFAPRPPVAHHDHQLAVVAKTRDFVRPVVADALAAGFRPAIYGSGWERFVDADLVVAQYIDNEALPDLYSSVGLLLNDHWGTMQAWGFVSNRLYDALACETPVVSDHLPEIDALFGDAVTTYTHPDELAAVVAAVLDDPNAARDRAARGREAVLRAHTFDHRARELLTLLAAHGLVRPGPTGD